MFALRSRYSLRGYNRSKLASGPAVLRATRTLQRIGQWEMEKLGMPPNRDVQCRVVGAKLTWHMPRGLRYRRKTPGMMLSFEKMP